MRPNNAYKRAWSDSLRKNKRIIHSKICLYDASFSSKYEQKCDGKVEKINGKMKRCRQIYPRVTLNLRHLWILIHPRNNSEEILLINRWKFRIEQTQSITRSLLPIVLKKQQSAGTSDLPDFKLFCGLGICRKWRLSVTREWVWPLSRFHSFFPLSDRISNKC